MLSAMGVTIMMNLKKETPYNTANFDNSFSTCIFLQGSYQTSAFSFQNTNFFMRFRRSSTLKKTENVDENGDFRKEF